MDVFSILQTIIALIFIYLIVSLIVTEVQEQLAALKQWRSNNLKQAITIFTGQEFANKLYDSKSLFSGFNQYANGRDSKGPSYVEKEVFAESLMGIIQADLNNNKTQNITLSPKQELFPVDKEKHITKILDSNQLNNYPELIERLKEIAYITKLKYDKPTVENFTAEIANTFDEIMERTTGVYKRNAKGVSLGFGLVVAVLFNIDTFHIVDRLYTDPDLRQGFDDLATKLVKDNNTCLGNATTDEARKMCQTKLKEETERIKISLAENQSLPIGWDENGWFNRDQLKSQNGLQAGLGWFISAIAISMGAPFWFELLGKVINVRNTLRPLSSQEMTSTTSEGVLRALVREEDVSIIEVSRKE